MSVLIVGLGSIAEKHIEGLKSISPDTVIYALRSSVGGKDHPGVHNIYHFNELPHKPDFVIISNPTEFHGKTISEAAELGCPLFIEKPVLSGLSNVEAIRHQIQQAKILTYVACNMRFHPVISFLKRTLDENKPVINEVNIYCGSYLPDWRPGIDFRKNYSANADIGGGAHLDLIHELDYAQWLFGYPGGIHSVKRNVSSLSVNAIDFAAYHLLYDRFTVNIILNYYRRDPERKIEILTDKDTIIADLLSGTVYSAVSGKQLFEDTSPIRETYTRQMRYFIHQIATKQQPMNDFDEGVETLKIALHG